MLNCYPIILVVLGRFTKAYVGELVSYQELEKMGSHMKCISVSTWLE